MVRRAESQQETRARIVEATMALHEELGPRRATISAIAERAGVQRLTVYRHFPDEAALFQACTSTWIERHPPPGPADWAGAAPGPARLRAALAALYAYYRRTQRMWRAAFRDEAEVPALRGPMEGFRAHLGTVRGDLLASLAPLPEGRLAPTTAAIGHALAFASWASLAGEGLEDDAMAALVTRWIEATAAPL